MTSSDVYIISEIASSHEGNRDHACRLVKLASETGADAVKLQIFRRDILISRFHPKYESFGEIELELDEWSHVIEIAQSCNIDVIIEAYDDVSLQFAEASGMATAYKIPTSDISNMSLLDMFAETEKPLFLGVGGATHQEIEQAVVFLKKKNVRDFVLLHGFQSYPTRIEDSHLSRIAVLKREFGLPAGYADHVDAEDHELARLLPMMAIAAGASVIEKHITDDRSRKGRDHYSALNPDEFTDFVSLMHRVCSAMGDGEIVLSEEEKNYRNMMKRQAVAKTDLGAGHGITDSDLEFKRTGKGGLTPADCDSLRKHTLSRSMKADEPIEECDLEG